MRTPDEYDVDRMLSCDTRNQVEIEKGKWVAARPEDAGFLHGPLHRFKMAWAVFTGKADALFWNGQQELGEYG